jgi:adenylyltransferase/sulfurtransferase
MKQVSPKELKEKLADNSGFFLLDVREDYEHEANNIGGELIPLSEVVGRSGEIPQDKPVIVYCRKGVRSQIAIQRLERKGFTNLFNLEGGIEAYNKL